jgi:hypothetical protein
MPLRVLSVDAVGVVGAIRIRCEYGISRAAKRDRSAQNVRLRALSAKLMALD